VLGLQVPAAYRNGELDDEELREIVVFVAHYAGWPVAARLSSIVEETIGKAAD
jgi:4-carboxymuconolactone decarboxylase